MPEVSGKVNRLPDIIQKIEEAQLGFGTSIWNHYKDEILSRSPVLKNVPNINLILGHVVNSIIEILDENPKTESID